MGVKGRRTAGSGFRTTLRLRSPDRQNSWNVRALLLTLPRYQGIVLFGQRLPCRLSAERERYASSNGRHGMNPNPALTQDDQQFLAALGRYSTPEVLKSDLARQTFVLSDRGARHAA